MTSKGDGLSQKQRRPKVTHNTRLVLLILKCLHTYKLTIFIFTDTINTSLLQQWVASKPWTPQDKQFDWCWRPFVESVLLCFLRIRQTTENHQSKRASDFSTLVPEMMINILRTAAPTTPGKWIVPTTSQVDKFRQLSVRKHERDNGITKQERQNDRLGP